MRTLVVGAGVIGTIYGWALSEAGVEVTHLLRAGRMGRYQAGVMLDVLDERKGHKKNALVHYPMRCVEAVAPGDGYDLIVVPTGAMQTEDTLRQLAPLSGSAIFLIMSGNWEGVAAFDRILGRDRYLLGYAGGGGTIRDELYWVNVGADIHLGEADGSSTDKLRRVVALFERADMVPEVHDDMLGWLWLHNATTIGFSAGFARYGDRGRLLRDGALLSQCVAATRELVELCRRRGVDVSRHPDVSYMSWPTWLIVLFMRVLWTTNKSMQRYTAHALASLPEAWYFYGAMVRTADELGVPAPTLKHLGPYLQAAVAPPLPTS
jgi:ketopantoate reductase